MSKIKSKLTPLVESLGDYEDCVVIKLKPYVGPELVRIGYFNGTERQIRVYKKKWYDSSVEIKDRIKPTKVSFDVWGDLRASYCACSVRDFPDSIVWQALLDCLDDFGVCVWLDGIPKGDNVPCPLSADATKASVKVGGLFQINIEHLVDKSTFKIECMACDQANYPGSQTVYLTHHALGSKFPIPDELPGISVGPFKSIDEFAEDSRRG